MSFIGIDVGTSFIKGAILNPDTYQLEHVWRQPFPNRLKLENPLLCEFDPGEVFGTVRSLIEDLLRLAQHCEGIIMCSQMHGLVLLDEHRRPVSNCISWIDHRGLMPHPSGPGTYLDALMRRTTESQRRRLGNELGLERPGCFLFWLEEQGLLPRDHIPASIPDYVMSVLCDVDSGVEATNASATGLFDLKSGDWDFEAIEALELHSLRFPPIRKAGEVVGHFTFGSQRIPCFTPVGDHQCALLGSLVSRNELSLNISTGAQISRITSRLDLGKHQTRPYFGGQFVHTYSDAPGGRALNVFLGLIVEFAAHQNPGLNKADPWAFIAEAVRAVEETSLKVDPVFFENRSKAAGGIRNIQEDNFTVGHLFRASFDEMASIYYALACHLWPEMGWKNIVFSGGLALKSDVFRELIQEKFRTDYRLCPFAEDTLFGLLLLTRVFSQRAASIQDFDSLIDPARAPLGL